jgi:hypothetical protein
MLRDEVMCLYKEIGLELQCFSRYCIANKPSQHEAGHELELLRYLHCCVMMFGIQY